MSSVYGVCPQAVSKGLLRRLLYSRRERILKWRMLDEPSPSPHRMAAGGCPDLRCIKVTIIKRRLIWARIVGGRLFSPCAFLLLGHAQKDNPPSYFTPTPKPPISLSMETLLSHNRHDQSLASDSDSLHERSVSRFCCSQSKTLPIP